jgi:SAM-dependent methyltransferase
MAVPALGLLRLNIGTGEHYADGWVNVDRHSLPHWPKAPDLMADVLEGIPLEDGCACKIFLAHILEHLPYDRVPRALEECRRLLAPGGQLAVVGPCIELAIRTGQPSWLLGHILANPTPEAPGLGHEWTPTAFFTLRAVQTVFPGAELVPVETIASPEWPNPSLAPWQCAVLATKL